MGAARCIPRRLREREPFLFFIFFLGGIRFDSSYRNRGENIACTCNVMTLFCVDYGASGARLPRPCFYSLLTRLFHLRGLTHRSGFRGKTGLQRPSCFFVFSPSRCSLCRTHIHHDTSVKYSNVVLQVAKQEQYHIALARLSTKNRREHDENLFSKLFFFSAVYALENR